MFKKMKKYSLAVLVVGATLGSSVNIYASDFVSSTLASCKKQGGQVIQDQVGEPREEKISDRKKKIITCYDILCYRATGNVGEVNFNSIDEFREQTKGERGAAQIAFDPNVCREDEVTVGRIGGLDDEIEGGVSVKWDGSVYTCDDTSDAIVCLRRNGIDIDFDYDISANGRDGDGRRILIVKRRSSSSGDSDGGSRRGDGGSRRGGGSVDIDASIGGDIDIDSDGRSRRGGSSSTRSRRGGSRSCSYGKSTSDCIGDYDLEIDISSDRENCAHCGYRRSSRSSSSSGWSGAAQFTSSLAELAGAVLPPVMYYKGVKAQASAYLGANQAHANAAISGFENCRAMQTSYTQSTYDYYTTNELPSQTVTPPGCNGYQYNQFAGQNGWGNSGWNSYGNPFMQGGYSSQFLGAMNGPNYQYNTGLNMTGMQYNPYGGLGLNGNLNLNSMLGLPANGLNFGLNAGVNGGYNGGYNGGWNNGGFNNGYNTGYTGGLNFNGSINPYFNATANGLVPYSNNGGYYNNGGYNNGGWNNGGYNNGGWNNGGNNSSVNGNNWWAVQNSFAQNQQASQIGAQYQNMGVQNQYNRAGNNMMSYNPAAYSPMNMGASLNYGFNFGIH